MIPRALALTLLLSASCIGKMQEIHASSQAAQEAIQERLGVPASVGWRLHAGTEGKSLVVTVHFGETPHGDAREIKAKVEALVRAQFKDQIDQLDVVF